MNALHRIVNDAITDGFCRWCRVLVGSAGHKATSECPVGIAEEELRDAATVLATVAQPTTPAPAWEWIDDGRGALLYLPPFTLALYRREYRKAWSWSVQNANTVEEADECPTAPEAARAAVAALRAIVVPVVEALDRVPELEMP